MCDFGLKMAKLENYGLWFEAYIRKAFIRKKNENSLVNKVGVPPTVGQHVAPFSSGGSNP